MSEGCESTDKSLRPAPEPVLLQADNHESVNAASEANGVLYVGWLNLNKNK